ncbi:MAG: AIPR family protein [Chthoniobacterales bacterium]
MKHKDALNGQIVSVPYHSIRNISSPEDSANNRTVLAGQLPIQSIVDLSTNENVRNYLVEAEGKKRKTRTQVHRAIRDTLEEHPDVFTVLNGGVVIVARESELDEKTKKLTLHHASIINGSQTQGVIREFLSHNPDAKIHIKFELIITDDDDLIAEISISRNFQNDVQTLSIVGRRGQLDELNESFQKRFPTLRLRKSETERPSDTNDYIQTEKLLQVIAALLPPELWWKAGELNKVYTYSAKATCLKDFQEIYTRSKDAADLERDKFVAIYEFYLGIAGEAYNLYEKWKEHQGFAGTGLRSISRDGGTITEVPDGIVFPILAALAEFAVRVEQGWTINPPKLLDDGELIRAAKSAYMEIAKSKPEVMGKTKACYSALQQITSIYKKFTKV